MSWNKIPQVSESPFFTLPSPDAVWGHCRWLHSPLSLKTEALSLLWQEPGGFTASKCLLCLPWDGRKTSTVQESQPPAVHSTNTSRAPRPREAVKLQPERPILQTTDNPAEHKWSSCTFSHHQRGNKAQKRGTLSPDLLGITIHSKDNQDTFATILEWAPAQFHCILKLDAVWNLNSHK